MTSKGRTRPLWGANGRSRRKGPLKGGATVADPRQAECLDVGKKDAMLREGIKLVM